MGIPFVEVMLDKPRKLRFGMGAVLEFEQLTNLKLMEVSENVGPEIAVKIAWVMFRQEDKELTLEKTAELIDEYYDGNIYDFITGISEAINIAFEDKKAKNPKNAVKPTSLPLKENTKSESAISA